jgi:fatty acid desaturase
MQRPNNERKTQSRRQSPYHLAFAQGAGKEIRRRAWKTILWLELLYIGGALIAEFFGPRRWLESTVGLVVLWSGLVAFVATLLWINRRGERRRDR